MMPPGRCAYADRVTSMTGMASWRWPWREGPARDVLIALAMTVVTVLGAYGEAHPTRSSDIVMNGHHVPHTPDAALLLVVAGRLFVSPLTAKTHVSRIMTKLNARDRAQLVVLAYESGLVTPGQWTAR
jgi:hypothetical protein